MDFGSSSSGLSNDQDHHTEFLDKTIVINSLSALSMQDYLPRSVLWKSEKKRIISSVVLSILLALILHIEV